MSHDQEYFNNQLFFPDLKNMFGIKFFNETKTM